MRGRGPPVKACRDPLRDGPLCSVVLAWLKEPGNGCGDTRISRRPFSRVLHSFEDNPENYDGVGACFAATVEGILKILCGGEGGIRTLDGLSPIHTFQACSFGRSDTSPKVGGDPPATPRRPSPLLPLLPSGPDGVHNLSSRGDRWGHHRVPCGGGQFTRPRPRRPVDRLDSRCARGRPRRTGRVRLRLVPDGATWRLIEAPAPPARRGGSGNRQHMPRQSEILYSACPHDCPSTCALAVERLDEGRIGRVRGAQENTYTAGGHLQQGRALRRAHPPPRPVDDAAASRRREGPARQLRVHLLGRRPRRRRRATARGRAAPRRGDGLALLLRRHHGPCHARRHQPPAPRQALLPPALDHLRHARLERLHRRDRQARRRRPARDGPVGSRGHLGHQRRRHADQRHDACPRGAAAAGRADRGHRHLPQRDGQAGGPVRVRASRHRRRAGLRRHARAVPRRPRQPRLSRALHGLSGSTRSAPGGPLTPVGGGRSPACRRRRSRPSRA